MTDNPPASELDGLDEHVLSLLEQYDSALRSGDTWEARSIAGLTETQRQVWEMATLSLNLLAEEKPRNDPVKVRESTAYLPARVGRYEIERMLGVGGFSIVYLGVDEYTRRQAAVKIPRPHVLLSPELRERFVREAQAAAKLDHPHIVPIYEAGQDGDLPYIAYAYCEGPTLGAWLKERAEPMSIRHAAEMVRTLAEAVQYSHDQGILHRDLTPGNVLLSPRASSLAEEFPFVPKLSDFGLAKLLESDFTETATSVMMGTPAYMAPEQAQRGLKMSGVPVDVYGLGAILYHALTGRAPFVRDTPWEVLAALKDSEPVAPHLLRSGLPRDLETVCLKCLEKSPEARYATAGELADDLGRYLGGQPVKARPASWVRRSWQWCRRHPSVAGLICAVVSAVFLLIGGLIWNDARGREFNQTLTDQNQRLQETITERDTALEEQAKAQHTAESRAQELRLAFYDAEIGRAAAAWKRGDVRTMLNSLNPFQKPAGTDSDLREFAWHYLWNQHAVRELFRQKMTAPQWTVRFSPDGSRVAYAGADSIVRLVSTSDVRSIQEIPTGQQEINGVLFGPQGDWLATAGDDGTVAVWNLPGGERRAVWRAMEKKAYQLAYREQENLLLVCGQSPDVHLLDFMSGEVVGRLTGGHVGMIESISLSPDANLLLTCGDDKTAGIWEVSERRLRHKLDVFDHYVSAGAWSADSLRVAIGSWDYGVSTWDVTTGERLSRTVLIDAVHSIDFAANGWIYAGDSGGAVSAIRDPLSPDAAPYHPQVAAGKYLSSTPNLFRCTHRVANTMANWATGFPTLEHGEDDPILGTFDTWQAVLLSTSLIELLDAPTEALIATQGGDDLSDLANLFRCANRWAGKKGYAGGFPVFEKAVDNNGKLNHKIACFRADEGVSSADVKVEDLRALQELPHGQPELLIRAACRWADRQPGIVAAIPTYEEGEGVRGVWMFASQVARRAKIRSSDLMATHGYKILEEEIQSSNTWMTADQRRKLAADTDGYAVKLALLPQVKLMRSVNGISEDDIKKFVSNLAMGKEPKDGIDAHITDVSSNLLQRFLLILSDSESVANGPRKRWSLHRHGISGLALSPDSRLLATASRDQAIGLFALDFSAPVRRRVLLDPFEIDTSRHEAGPDRQGRIYRLSQDGIHIFDDASTERPDSKLNDRRYASILWRDDDQLFAFTAQGEIFHWDTADDPQLVETVSIPVKQFHACELLGPNRVLIKAHQSDIGVWNLSERRFERTWQAHRRMAVAPGGRMFVLARDGDAVLVLYDAETLQETAKLSGHTRDIYDVEFSRDGGRLYSCGSDRSIRVWDIESRREILQLRGHEASVECLAVTPDEKTLASADETGSVRLWDLRTGRELFELFQHERKFRQLEFTTDGQDLLAIDNDLSKLVEFRWSWRASLNR